MKKLIAIVLVLVMALSLAACGTQGEVQKPASSGAAASTPASSGAEDPNVEKKVIVGISTDPESWGPWERFNNGRQAVMPMVYQTLTADVIDPDSGESTTYYVMASGWEQIDDTTYEITVREGITDTAGNPFKASDAAFSYDACKEKGVLAQLNAIDHTEVISDYVFRIITNGNLAVGDFEDLLTAINMVTEASFKASSDGMATGPVGTTGYVMSQYTAGSRVVFTKAEQPYWNEAANESKSLDDGYCFVWDTTKVDTVQYEIITDSSTMAVALESGQVNISANVSSDDMVLFREGGADADKFSVFTYPDNLLNLNFNCSDDSVCKNENLRKAIAYAVDCEGILAGAYNGDGWVATAWSFPTFRDYQAEWDKTSYYPYDMAEAQKYFDKFLEETGMKAADVHLRLLIQNSRSVNTVAQIIQSNVGKLTGNELSCEILSYDRSSYNSMYEDSKAFDMFIMGDQANRVYSTYAWNQTANNIKSGDGTTQWFVNDDELQELVMAAVSTKTHSDKTVKAFNQFVTDNCFQYSMIAGDIYVVAANWISKLGVGPKNCLAVCSFDYDWSAK